MSVIDPPTIASALASRIAGVYPSDITITIRSGDDTRRSMRSLQTVTTSIVTATILPNQPGATAYALRMVESWTANSLSTDLGYPVLSIERPTTSLLVIPASPPPALPNGTSPSPINIISPPLSQNTALSGCTGWSFPGSGGCTDMGRWAALNVPLFLVIILVLILLCCICVCACVCCHRRARGLPCDLSCFCIECCKCWRDVCCMVRSEEKSVEIARNRTRARTNTNSDQGGMYLPTINNNNNQQPSFHHSPSQFPRSQDSWGGGLVASAPPPAPSSDGSFSHGSRSRGVSFAASVEGTARRPSIMAACYSPDAAAAMAGLKQQASMGNCMNGSSGYYSNGHGGGQVYTPVQEVQHDPFPVEGGGGGGGGDGWPAGGYGFNGPPPSLPQGISSPSMNTPMCPSAKEQKSAQRALRKMERADYKSERNLMKAGQGGAQPSPTGFTNGSSPFGAAAAMSTYESSPHLTVVPPPLPPGPPPPSLHTMGQSSPALGGAPPMRSPNSGQHRAPRLSSVASSSPNLMAGARQQQSANGGFPRLSTVGGAYGGVDELSPECRRVSLRCTQI